MIIVYLVDEERTFMADKFESAGIWPPRARDSLDSGLRSSWVVVWKLEEDMMI
jgi:hypothetical protein